MAVATEVFNKLKIKISSMNTVLYQKTVITKWNSEVVLKFDIIHY